MIIRFYKLFFYFFFFITCNQIVAATYQYTTVPSTAFDNGTTNIVWEQNQTNFPIDDDRQTVNIGFTFYLGNTPYTQVAILSNGALHFGANQGFHKDYLNEALAITSDCNSSGSSCPGFEEPADRVILPYWDDLEPSAGGTVRYSSLGSAPNRRFVATWNSVKHYGNPSATGSYTFEAILYETGEVRFRYASSDATGSSATIGIEIDDSDFTEFSYNSNSINPSLDILFKPTLPTIQSVSALCSATNSVIVTYSTDVPPSFAVNPNNYSINNGITISSATLTSSNSVTLTTSALTSGVNYTLSTNSPLVQNVAFMLSNGGTITVADNFGGNSFSNNDGTQNWVGSWIEYDLDNGGNAATTGHVTVNGGHLSINERPNLTGQPSIAREVNLSLAGTSTLSFDWSTTSGVDNSDSVLFEISNNGGGSWTTLENFTNYNGTNSGTRSYNITAYNAVNTRIRFSINNLYQGSNENFEVDNLLISFQDQTACTPSVDHYLIEHDGQGLTCQAETITIKACTNASCSTLSTESVNLDFSADGIIKNNITFTGSTNVSLSQLTPDILTLALINESISPANPTVCDDSVGTSCDIEFVDSGFIFDVPTQTSCNTSGSITISAIRKDLTSQQCVPGFSNVNKTLKFWTSYLNPATGSKQLTLTQNSINYSLATSEGTSVSIAFDVNGEAVFNVNYADAGELRLNASFDGTGSEAGLRMLGQDDFVNKPAQLNLYSPDANASCATNDASCTVFKKAGENFNLAISASCADGTTITPNFEMANIPLSINTIAPSLGNLVSLAVTNVTFSNPADNGVRTIANQSVSEVGVFNITAIPALNGYLGETIAATTSASIGRFTPAYFDFNLTPLINSCSGFTYGGYLDGTNAGLDRNGQTFTIEGQIQAHKLGGGITQNYTGDFLKFDQTDITAVGYDNDDLPTPTIINTLNFNINPANFIDNGNGTISFTDPASHYQFNAEREPLSLVARMNVTDSDLVTTAPGVNWDTSAIEQRLGRMILQDSYGPEISNLEMRLKTEYFSATGWTLNTADSCSTYIDSDSSFTAYTDNLDSGETAPFLPTGTAETLVSGISSIGNGLWYSAPGDGNYGSVQVNFDLLTQGWLRYDWTGGDDIIENFTSGTLNFGYYRGSDRVIYWREE